MYRRKKTRGRGWQAKRRMEREGEEMEDKEEGREGEEEHKTREERDREG